MNSKISERIKINSEIVAPTSAAGATSLNYDMQGFQRAHIAVCVDGTCTGPVTLDLLESSGATVAGTSAAGSKAGIAIGGVSTLMPTTGGVRAIKLTMGTATTSETFRMAIGSGPQRAFTFTSAAASTISTAWTSTQFYYGSSVGSTADTGLQLSIDSLKSALASTIGFGNIFQFSTPTTVTLGIKLMDSATGSIFFSNTNSSVVPLCEWNQAVGAYDIGADELTSTLGKRYVGVKMTSVTTGVGRGSVVVARYGAENPPIYPGQLSS